MTATFAELMFSGAFLVMMNAGIIFALAPEEQSLRAMSAVVAVFRRTLTKRRLSRNRQGSTAVPQDRLIQSLPSLWRPLHPEGLPP